MDIAHFSVKADSTDLLKLNRELKNTETQSEKTEKKTSRVETALNKMGAATLTAAKGMVAFGAAAAAAGVKAVMTFAELEKGLVGVQKTTDFTAKEMTAFKKSIDDMARRVPVATTDLLKMAGVAGQLGIKGVENVSKFTEVMGKLSLATNIVGEDGAAKVARLLNVVGEGVDTVDTFGAVLVGLGNNSAATESEILGLATEIGQATSTFSVGSKEALAMGAAMKSLGVRAELGGSVVGRAMRMIEASIESGGKEMKLLSDVTGIAEKDLKSAFGDNATAVFESWLKGVGRLTDGGQSAASVLESFGLKGEEILKVLPTMAVNSGVLTDALRLANDEFAKGTALEDEVAKASDILAAKWQLLKNRVTEFSGSMGEKLAPIVTKVLEDFMSWYDVNGELLKQDLGRWIETISGPMITLAKVTGTMLKSLQGWSAVGQGRLDFLKFAVMDAEDLEKWLEKDKQGLIDIENKIKQLRAESENIRYSIFDNGAASGARKKAIQAEIDSLNLQKEVIINLAEVTEENYVDAWLRGGQQIIKTHEETNQSLKDKDKEYLDSWLFTEQERTAAAVRSALEIEKAEEELAEKRATLSQSLEDKIKQAVSSEYEYKVYLLDKEVEKMREVAGEDQVLQDRITEYRKKTYDKLTGFSERYTAFEQKQINEMTDSWLAFENGKVDADKRANDLLVDGAEDATDKIEDEWRDLKDAVNSFTKDMVQKFIDGEENKKTVSKLASDAIAGYAEKNATAGVEKLIDSAVMAIQALLAKGVSGVMAADDWKKAGASALKFLGQAGVAIFAAKKLAKSAKADGGPIENHASGGWINRNANGGMVREGSGIRDDVFAGITPGNSTAHYIMGGEYVINRKSTRKHKRLLEAINQDKHADGGSIDNDASDLANGLNGKGFGAFVSEWIKNKSWQKGVAAAVRFYATYGGTALLARKFGKKALGLADGGLIRANHSIGDFLDPGGIFDDKDPWDILNNISYGMFDPLYLSLYATKKGKDPSDWKPKDWSGAMDPLDKQLQVLLGKKNSEKISKLLNLGAEQELSIDKIVARLYEKGYLDDFFLFNSRHTLNDILKPWVRDVITPQRKHIQWGDNMDENIETAYSGVFDDIISWVYDLVKGGKLQRMLHSGTSNVPVDGKYQLAQNERVLSAVDNASLVLAVQNSAAGNKELKMLLSDIKKVIESGNFAIAKNTLDQFKILRQWEGAGLPETR